MNKKISAFGQKFEPVPLIATILAIIVLVMLGNWQLRRLEQKREFIALIRANLAGTATILADNEPATKLYSKIKISGHFLEGKDIFLYGRRSASPEKDGYYLLSPFLASNGKIFLVLRGWLPYTIKNNITNFIPPKNEEIIAVTLPGEERKLFIPENDQKNKIWFTLDLNMAAETIGITDKNFYLMQINSLKLPPGTKPLSGSNLNKIRNDHLEYAITWYSLAICLLVIYLIYHSKQSPKK